MHSLRSTLLVLSGLTLSGTASAAATLVDGSGLRFTIQENVTFSTQSSASAAAQEAAYTHAVPSTTANGAATSVTLIDAFDGYNGVSINDVVYNNNGAATAECDGQGLAFNPQTIGDLTVTRHVFVSPTEAFARWMTVVTNNAGAATEVALLTLNNLGSDSNTVTLGSSSGDAVGDDADTWVATGGDPRDPRLAHVLGNGLGTVNAAGLDFTRNSGNNPTWGYTFTLAPGATGTIVHYVSGQPTNAAALAVAPIIHDLGQAFTACMTQEQWDQVLNFGFDCSSAGDTCNEGYYAPETGACATRPANEAGACDDGDECTMNDVCAAGTCAGEHDPACDEESPVDDTADDSGPDDSEPPGDDKDCGCTSTGTPASGLAGLALLGLVGLARRRRG